MKNADAELTKFEPSELQMKTLKAAYSFDGKPTITALCEEAGIARETWYDWNKDERFVSWWNAAWDRHMQNSMWQLDRISYKQASKDFRYMEMLQMKYAKYRKSTDITSGGEPVNFVIFDEDKTPKDNGDTPNEETE